jgi:hypothetical protein
MAVTKNTSTDPVFVLSGGLKKCRRVAQAESHGILVVLWPLLPGSRPGAGNGRPSYAVRADRLRACLRNSGTENTQDGRLI